MKLRKQPAKAVMLVICLLLSLFPGVPVRAAQETGKAYTETTPVYVLIKEEPAGRWLTRYNFIHNIVINGTTFPAYCLESMLKSPNDGVLYHTIDPSAMGYSDRMMTGMREILRNGYPYTTKICGYNFGNDTVAAQSATQIAARMWASYQKEQEGASYLAFSFWNPEPKRGTPLVKMGTADGAEAVWGAATALFQLAKSGAVTTINAAFAMERIVVPTESTGGGILVYLKVSLTNCEYATLSFSEEGAEIISVSKGTAQKIEEGAEVTVRVPASAAGHEMTVTASGYSTKASSSLHFYQEDTRTMQRLFVGRTDRYGVTITTKTVALPTPTPTPVVGKVSVSKKALTSGSSSAGPGQQDDNGELAGARLQILDETGKVVYEWVTDGKERQLNGVLEAGKTYILHEAEAPFGYTLAKDQTFTVHADGSLSRVVMEDKPTRVEISKKSALDGSELAGARLQIFEGEKLITEWVTDGRKRTFTGLLKAGGTYRLHEAEAPKGYVLAADITFTVGTNGETDRVEMVDDYTRVVISKRSYGSEEALAGASLQILDGTGQVVDEWVSNGLDHETVAMLTPGGCYTLHETEAPAGYVLGDDVIFTVPRGAETGEVVIYNAKMALTSPITGDGTGNYVLYGIFAFLAAFNTSAIRRRGRKRGSLHGSS
ncbi:MAG: hypothetical protein J5648_03710 [Lachnospiraceae bacterium]|nr:hypothetical protein [Lachnospiraceae bacterium]